jgi:hypothetical protein
MSKVYINDSGTKEVLKGKTLIAEIVPSIFEGYINIVDNQEVTAIVLSFDEVRGIPVVIAEAYPEDAPGGTMAEIEHFPFTESTTIKELFEQVSAWVQESPVAR